jgi:hypothetical protein
VPPLDNKKILPGKEEREKERQIERQIIVVGVKRKNDRSLWGSSNAPPGTVLLGDKSYSAMYGMLKWARICPSIVSKSTIYYLHVLSTPYDGNWFRLVQASGHEN